MSASRSESETREELLQELSMHLGWASRFNPASPSRKHLRDMFATAPVLNLIEELVTAALSPFPPTPEQEGESE